MALTQEDIFAAADALQTAGTKVTIESVREFLGKGSFATISPAVSLWKAEREKASRARVAEPLPATLADRMTRLGGDLWAAALELANQRLAAERSALEDVRASAEAARAEAAEAADRLATKLDETTAQLIDSQANLTAAQEALEQVRRELQKANERALTADARNQELVKRIDDLNAELARVNAHNVELARSLSEAALRAHANG